MGSESTPLLRTGQFRLRALLAATAVVGVLLAIARWAGANRHVRDLAGPGPGALPTQWALVVEAVALALLIAVAAGQHRLRLLFFSMEAMTFLGGVIMFTSGFFAYVFRRWIPNHSLYGNFGWSVSPCGLLMLLSVWPMAFGAITTALSYVAIVAGRTSASRWRWTVTGLFLGGLAVAEMTLALRPSGLWWPDRSTWMTSLIVSDLVLASLAVIVGFVRDGDRKIRLMNLVAVAELIRFPLPGIMINGGAVPLTNVPWMRSWNFGPGYWLLWFGAVLILISSIALLWSTRGTRSRGFEHRAQDTRA